MTSLHCIPSNGLCLGGGGSWPPRWQMPSLSVVSTRVDITSPALNVSTLFCLSRHQHRTVGSNQVAIDDTRHPRSAIITLKEDFIVGWAVSTSVWILSVSIFHLINSVFRKTHKIIYFIPPLLFPTENKNFGLPVNLEFNCYLRHPPPSAFPESMSLFCIEFCVQIPHCMLSYKPIIFLIFIRLYIFVLF